MWSMSQADVRALWACLAGPHMVRPQVEVTDLSGRVIADLSDRLIEGQRDIQIAESRMNESHVMSCKLTVADGKDVGLGTSDPTRPGNIVNRMIHIDYSVGSLDGKWWTAPIFTGPVTTVTHTDGTIDVECVGREYLARRAMHRTRRWPKGQLVYYVLRDVLEMCGLRRQEILIDRVPDRLRNDVTAVENTDLWFLAQSLAGSWRGTVWMDGAGRAHASRVPGTPVGVLTTGTGGTVTKVDAAGLDMWDGWHNVWHVTGAADKNKTVPSATVTLPSSDPMSPDTLRANGARYGWIAEIDDQDVTTAAQAKARATEAMNDEAHHARLTAKLECVPNPLLEPFDTVRVATPEWTVNMQIRESSLPLHPAAMTIGASRDLSRRALKWSR